jgi:hypothetical protein
VSEERLGTMRIARRMAAVRPRLDEDVAAPTRLRKEKDRY